MRLIFRPTLHSHSLSTSSSSLNPEPLPVAGAIGAVSGDLGFESANKQQQHQLVRLLMASSQESSKMEEEGGSGCQVPEGPIRCLNNCGFFGSVATMNLCSKCYTELNKPSFSSSSSPTQTLTLTPATAADSNTLLPVLMQSSSGEASDPSAAFAAVAEAATRKRSNRCFSCSKRVGLTAFKCRCGDMFCGQHRYSDMHACTFDYKAAGRDAIFRANPVVKAPKIEKI